MPSKLNEDFVILAECIHKCTYKIVNTHNLEQWTVYLYYEFPRSHAYFDRTVWKNVGNYISTICTLMIIRWSLATIIHLYLETSKYLEQTWLEHSLYDL